jgi:exodeoxyribonuclease-5
MKWSPQQDDALIAIDDWSQDDEPCFRLFGFAGTGKTEIAREIGQQVKGAVFAAYTGKAVDVLRKRGCAPVSTIHRLIYHHLFDEKTGTHLRILKSRAELSHIRLLIIDEASMIDAELARDLLSFGIKTLVIADPMQLPPPSDREGYFMQFEPDVMLDEVHRQALDSPILRLATDVREGKGLWKKKRYEGLLITDGLYSRDGLDYDVVLTGTNSTKDHWNHKVRVHRGFLRASAKYREPQVGETLVCKRNDYRVCDEVFNGQLWKVHRVSHDTVRTSSELIPILRLDLRNDDGRTAVCVRAGCFNGGATFLRGLQHFEFGYAITVHSAQGSEWDKVMLINEARAFRGCSRQWLYTGITRATDKLTIIDGS